ncbi:MAG: hypothetical protein QW412_03645, partial [Candidatus Aenigmatarchaeota archaeon]
FLSDPDENKKWRYVIQAHFRGTSLHLDFRCEREFDLIGWTLLVQIPEEIKEPVTTLEQARKIIESKDFKIDFEKGEIRKRKIKGGIIRRAEIRVVKKAPEPKEWISVEGVMPKGEVGATKEYPGVFLIVDKGRVEFGAQKDRFHEYFLSEGKLKSGRWIFRALPQRITKEEEILPEAKLPKETEIREPFYWVLMQPEIQTPYVLDKDSIEKDWLPPFGISALPEAIRKNVPKNLRYWNERNKKKALEQRLELSKMEELNIKPEILKHSQINKFSLFRVAFKRTKKGGEPVIVVRFGPSTEFFILKIGEKKFFCEHNPFVSETLATLEKVKFNFDKVTGKKYLEPGSELNKTKNTSAWIEKIDSGDILIYEDKPSFIKFKKDKDIFIIFKEEDEEFWTIKKSEGPNT